MSHVSNGWLARHLRQAADRLGPSRDNAAAYERGWQSARLRRGTWSYRDPRFAYRKFALTEPSSGCEFCDDKIAQWLYAEPEIRTGGSARHGKNPALQRTIRSSAGSRWEIRVLDGKTGRWS